MPWRAAFPRAIKKPSADIWKVCYVGTHRELG